MGILRGYTVKEKIYIHLYVHRYIFIKLKIILLSRLKHLQSKMVEEQEECGKTYV